MTKECEKIAQMMIRCSLATGHGDTVEDLLEELEAQIKELHAERDRFRELYAKEAHAKMVLSERAEKAEAEEITRLRELNHNRFEEGIKFQERAEKAEAKLEKLMRAANDPNAGLWSFWNDKATEFLARAKSAEAELAQARKALEPFAKSDMVGLVDAGYRGENSVVYGVCDFTYADLDNARRALITDTKEG